jgi:hypothetical protein
MAAVSYQVTIAATATPQRLTSAFPADDRNPGGKYDVPLRVISFQALKATANDIFVGTDTLVSSTVHAFRVDPGDTQPPIIFGSFDTGGSRFSDYYVSGTANDVLLIHGILY